MLPPKKNPRFSNKKSALLKCYFSLQAETKKAIWLGALGKSMLTLFRQGDRVRIQTDADTFQVGQVVVFFRCDKMFAHRIVDYDPHADLWITKGDTLFFFDRPIKQSEFLGQIDCIEKKGRRYPVDTDLETAHLSATLGNRLIHQLNFLPNWLKFLYYFSFFIPGYLWLKIQRKYNKSNLYHESP